MFQLLDLPDIVLELIISKLNYVDISYLRQTCKSLRDFLDNYTFTRLYLMVNKSIDNRPIFNTNERINSGSSLLIKCEKIMSLDQILKLSHFNRLRRLIIIHGQDYHYCRLIEYEWCFNLEILNRLQELVHLELDVYDVSGSLNLNSLKVCSIETKITSRFKIACNRLVALRLSPTCLRYIIIRSPYLRFLSLSSPPDNISYNNSNFVTMLKRITSSYDCTSNLTTLCSSFTSELIHILDSLNNKQLHLPSLQHYRLEFSQRKCSKDFFKYLLELHSALEMYESRVGNLRLTLEQQPVSSNQLSDMIKSMQICSRLEKKFCRRMFLFLKYSSDRKHISPLIKCFSVTNDDIDCEEFDALQEILKQSNSIERLRLIGIKKANTIHDLISYAGIQLKSLHLQEICLNRVKFPNQLTDHLINLETLQLIACPITNLNFVLRLPKLKTFKIDQAINKSLLIALFTKSRPLKRLEFTSREMIGKFFRFCETRVEMSQSIYCSKAVSILVKIESTVGNSTTTYFDASDNVWKSARFIYAWNRQVSTGISLFLEDYSAICFLIASIFCYPFFLAYFLLDLFKEAILLTWSMLIVHFCNLLGDI